jgi:hypothetical protein
MKCEAKCMKLEAELNRAVEKLELYDSPSPVFQLARELITLRAKVADLEQMNITCSEEWKRVCEECNNCKAELATAKAEMAKLQGEGLSRHHDPEGDEVLVNHDFLNCKPGIECCIASLGYYACDLQHNRFGIDEIEIPFDTTRRQVLNLIQALGIETTSTKANQ